MLSFEVSTVLFIADKLKSVKKNGGAVKSYASVGNRTDLLAALFGEKIYGSVFKTAKYHFSSVYSVCRDTFSCGNNTAFLLDKRSAFSVLAS